MHGGRRAAIVSCAVCRVRGARLMPRAVASPSFWGGVPLRWVCGLTCCMLPVAAGTARCRKIKANVARHKKSCTAPPDGHVLYSCRPDTSFFCQLNFIHYPSFLNHYLFLSYNCETIICLCNANSQSCVCPCVCGVMSRMTLCCLSVVFGLVVISCLSLCVCHDVVSVSVRPPLRVSLLSVYDSNEGEVTLGCDFFFMKTRKK